MLSAAYGLAAVAEIPLVSALTLASSWITALRIVGSSVTLLAVVALLFLPAISPSHERAAGGVLPFRLLKRPRVATAVLLEILAVPLGSYALSQVGISAQDLRLAATFGTVAVMIAAITNTLGRFTSGLLSDHVSVNGVMLAIVLLDATGGLLLWRTDVALVLLIASGMIGLACGGLSGAVPRLAHDAFPEAFNATSGLLYAAFALGSFTGPLLGSTFGGGKTAWLVLGSLSASGLLLLVFRIVEARHCSQPREERARPPVQV
jgi:predicted MFS family arabinose efflux permease